MKRKLWPLTALAVGVAAVIAYTRHHRAYAYRFQGKAVVITGGSRGLGLALARRLADEGARVALLARDWAELERAQRDLIERGATSPMIVQCDVRDEDSVKAAIDIVQRAFTRIDVLINCAGIVAVGPLAHMTNADFGDAMQTHFWGPLHVSQAVLPIMRAQKRGRIVNIASLAGKMGVPHLGPYSASKAALVGLSEAMRAELAAEHITVTTVCPSAMRVGSHMNAFYKGRHADEFAWFSILSATPLISTEADAAARMIVAGCRRCDAQVIISPPMRLALVLNDVFPNLMAGVFALIARVLPSLNPDDGHKLKVGWEARSPLTPSALTHLNDVVTEDLNGLRGHAPLVDRSALYAQKFTTDIPCPTRTSVNG